MPPHPPLLLTLLLTLTLFPSSSALLDGASAIWYPSLNASRFVLLRSPAFVLPPGRPTTASLLFTASQSPNVAGSGTTQSKLLGAAKIWVNGVLYTAGPGHNVPASQQAVVAPSATDGFAALFRPSPAENVIAVESFFMNSYDGKEVDAQPGVQLQLNVSCGSGASVTVNSDSDWLAYPADSFYNPDGDNNLTPWYVCPNEDLDARARPTGWEAPGFVPGPGWVPAAVQPSPFSGRPLYREPAPAPAMLSRAPCAIATLAPTTSTCGSAPEQSSVTLSCAGPGGVINRVLFASFGTPSGQCSANGNTFAVNSTCNSPNSTAVVTSLCLGRSSCTIPVSNAEFGGVDPCHLVPKHLSVAVNCSGGGGGITVYHYLVDFGQEFMGGVNLTFAGSPVPANATVLLQLGEELLPSGSVMVPTRAAQNYTARWTLKPTEDPGGDPANAGLHQHEFIEFRYAEIHSPVPLGPGHVRAWVVQHPFRGTGENPFEHACSTSTPNVPPPSPTPAPPNGANAFGWFASSNPGLDAVFNFTAYTAVATSLDINVDSQTRQRDLCHIDALITGLEQFAVFPPLDTAVQRRTFLDAFGNDSAIWGSWTEFKMSGALMAYALALEAGDLSVAEATWSDDDFSLTASADFNSLQFYSGVRYFNGSGNGLLHFPADCGGSWACDPLVDWPTTTRDGYVIDGNDDDAIRNGLGATALRGLAAVAGWLGKTDAQARYTAYADSVSAALLRTMYRVNASNPGEAYFTDGAGETHAALHSTLYAVAGGVLDAAGSTQAFQIAPLLTAYLRRRDVAPSSCMTGRWYVQALYQLGVYTSDAADFALELLSRTTYPSWGNMIAEWNATTTLEAWAPGDKWNTDWAHPWCASPAFLIPRLLFGFQPTDLGWRSFLAAPQPGNLTVATGVIPTPLGSFAASFAQDGLAATVALNFTVPNGSSARVCLPPLHADVLATHRAAPGTTLLVNNQPVPTSAWGRLLCAVTNLGPGAYAVVRV